MMGYDTEFGQMECLRQMSESNYRQKKIGYLGLSQLLNEHSPVLMMATNRMILDMNDDNDLVVALPLVLIAELSTEDMCRAMAREVAKVILKKNQFLVDWEIGLEWVYQEESDIGCY